MKPVCPSKHYFSEAQLKCVEYPECPTGQYFDTSDLRCTVIPVCL